MERRIFSKIVSSTIIFLFSIAHIPPAIAAPVLPQFSTGPDFIPSGLIIDKTGNALSVAIYGAPQGADPGGGGDNSGVGGSVLGNQGNDSLVGNPGGVGGTGGDPVVPPIPPEVPQQISVGDTTTPPEKVTPPSKQPSTGETTPGEGINDGTNESFQAEKDVEEKTRRVGYMVYPSVSIGADGYTHIINLSTNAMVDRKIPEQEEIQSSAGFKVVKMRQGSLSLGVSTSSFIKGLPVTPDVGLSIGGGRTWVSENYVSSYDEAKRLPFITGVPNKKEELDRLAIGDSLTFVTFGTMSIHAGISYFAVSGGVEANLYGEWTCNVRKVGRNLVQVAYTKGKIGSIAITAGAVIPSFAKKWYKGLEETQAYEFNLSHPDGFALYNRMLRGDVKSVKKYYLRDLVFKEWGKYAAQKRIPTPQTLAKMAATKWKYKTFGGPPLTSQQQRDLNTFLAPMAAKMISIGTRHTEGTSTSASIGIPILVTKTWVPKQRDVVVENYREVRNGVIGTTYSGIFKDLETVSGFFYPNTNRVKLFMGSVQNVTYLNPGQNPINFLRIYGQFKYSFGGQQWEEKDWDVEILNLSRRIGFKEELQSIPRPYPYESQFGQISTDLLLSQNSMIGLMTWAGNNTPKGLIDQSVAEIEKWFARSDNKRTELCEVLIRPLCEKKMKYETEKGIKMAAEALKEMADQFPTGKENAKYFAEKLKRVAKHMARFGEGFTRTQFSLNAFLNLARRGNGDQFMIAQWMGAAIKRDQKILVPSKIFSFRGHTLCAYAPNKGCGKPNQLDPM